MVAEMPLNKLRQARDLSQQMLAELLQVQQPSVAKIEKRTDMHLSTLRSRIEAMGGELDVVARFPDGTVNPPTSIHLPQSSIGRSTLESVSWAGYQ